MYDLDISKYMSIMICLQGAGMRQWPGLQQEMDCLYTDYDPLHSIIVQMHTLLISPILISGTNGLQKCNKKHIIQKYACGNTESAYMNTE